jgi:thymidylate synthase (FAD)
MIVQLVDYTSDPEYRIGRFAGICYNAKHDRDSCIKRAVKCYTDGHLATLRFAYATFYIGDISRVCSHQLVRSKHLDFLQQSQRYVEQTAGNTTYTYPVGLTEEQKKAVDAHYYQSMWLYEDLRKAGIKKEDARFVLPEATHTSMYVTGNLQAWDDFLKLRADKHAQWEIQEVAKSIGQQLADIAPNLFGKYNERLSNI